MFFEKLNNALTWTGGGHGLWRSHVQWPGPVTGSMYCCITRFEVL